jgi:hypothetical protein
MHDPDERPRLRWRMLGWLAGALLLLPVLYVAASGPLLWWDRNHYRQAAWMSTYERTFEPLSQLPQIGPMLMRYQVWWVGLPAPRFWQRQFQVDRLAHCRGLLEEARKNIAQTQGQLAVSQPRLDALDSRSDLTPEQSREAIQLRSEIESLENRMIRYFRPALSEWEQAVHDNEEALREFDRRE